MEKRIDIDFQIKEIQERFDYNIEAEYNQVDKCYRTVTNGIIKNYFDTEKEVEAYLMAVFDMLALNQYNCLPAK